MRKLDTVEKTAIFGYQRSLGLKVRQSQLAELLVQTDDKSSRGYLAYLLKDDLLRVGKKGWNTEFNDLNVLVGDTPIGGIVLYIVDGMIDCIEVFTYEDWDGEKKGWVVSIS